MKKEIILFYTRYCGKCFALRKRITKLKETNKFEFNYEFINAETEKKQVKKYKIDSVPTLIYYEDDVEVKRISGSIYDAALETLLK